MYINNVLYCFYSSDTEAFEACFRLLHDDDDDDSRRLPGAVEAFSRFRRRDISDFTYLLMQPFTLRAEYQLSCTE